MAILYNFIRIFPLNKCLIARAASISASVARLPPLFIRTFTKLSKFDHQLKLTSNEAGPFAHQQPQRFYSKNPKTDESAPFIDLMDVPPEKFIGGRSIFSGIFGWIAIRTAIRSVDPNFNSHDFIRGAGQAIEVLSQRLANEEYDELQEIVAPQAIETLKGNISKMTEIQRSRIAVKREDFERIFWSEIKLIEDKNVEPPKRFIEISVKFVAIVSKPKDVEEFKKFM